jgi:uncharacterized membrane protein YqaE (UPF0057 family)
MKNRIGTILLLFVAIIAISSCTMEKRRYQSGYYIDWGKNGSFATTAMSKEQMPKADHIAATKLLEPSIEVETVQAPASDISASSDNSFVPAKKLSVNHPEKKAEVTAPKKISKYKAYKALKKAVKEHRGGGDNDIPEIVLILLCIFLPPIAVGLMTDWEFEPLAINILLCLLCWLPGIIHAFIIYDRGR